MKSKILRFCSAAILPFLVFQSANAGDVVVISHQGTTIYAAEIRDIFLGEKQFAGSTKLIPVDNAALQESFLPKFMQMDAAKYNSIWTKKSFRDGLIPPEVKSGDAEVIDYVKRTPGAIGYISSKPAGVNVVR